MAVPSQGLTVTLSGKVSCGDCGSVGVQVRGPGGEQALLAILLAGPGPFTIDLPAGFGEVNLFGFRDLDQDGTPDPDTLPVACPKNPVNVEDKDIAGLDVDLGTLPKTEVVEVSGSVSCDGCDFAVGVRVYGVGGVLGSPLLALALDKAGLFSFQFPEDFGEVSLDAFFDADKNLVPDSGTAAVAYPGNPITVAKIDISGVAIDLGPPPKPPDTVKVSGSVACAGCDLAMGVRVYGAGGVSGSPLLALALDKAGPFSFELPEDFGEVSLDAFFDADKDLYLDPGTAAVAYPGNPITVAKDDISGVAIDLGAPPKPPDTVKVSGSVACAGCDLPVGIRVYGVGGAMGSPLFAVALEKAGPFSFELPEDFGEVSLDAFFDADKDLVPDPGTTAVAHPGNPITIAKADVSGVAINLGSPPQPTKTVRLSGQVTCGGCGLPLAVQVFGPGGVESGSPILAVLVDKAGPYALDLPEGFGEVSLLGFLDQDRDGVPDAGTSPASCPENPVNVGKADVTGLDITIEPPAIAKQVKLSGEVTCGGCSLPLAVQVFGQGGVESGSPILAVLVDKAGPYAFDLPEGFGAVSLAGCIDVDRDGMPDPDTKAGACPKNPISVADKDIAGLDIAVEPPPVPPMPVKLSGKVLCASCPGGVGIQIFGPGGAGVGGLLLAVLLDAPGPYSIDLPDGFGEANLYGFVDSDKDGTPDPGVDLVPCPKNPVTVGQEDIEGLDIDLDAVLPDGDAPAEAIEVPADGAEPADEAGAEPFPDAGEPAAESASEPSPEPGPDTLGPEASYPESGVGADTPDAARRSPNCSCRVAGPRPVTLAGPALLAGLTLIGFFSTRFRRRLP
jgi:hypothetical protein